MENDTATIDPSEVVFAEPTPSQQDLIWRISGVSWASPLSITDYIAKERHLSQQDVTKNGGLRRWILYRASDPSEIIASCQTTWKPAMISESGGVRSAEGFSFAALHTNPKYRRMGMARLLIRHVLEFMDSAGDCSFLYSDIGKGYYSRFGWVAYPSYQATLALLPRNVGDPASTPTPFHRSQPGHTRYLTKDEVKPICEESIARLKERLESVSRDGKTHVAFMPTYPVLSWQFARAEFGARKLRDKEITNRGAVTADGKSWVTWEHHFRSKEFRVQCMVLPNGAPEDVKVLDIIGLLEAALEEASSWDFRKVVVWNPDTEMTRGCKALSDAYENTVKAVFHERTDTLIPYFRWSSGRDQSNTMWDNNFYYGCC